MMTDMLPVKVQCWNDGKRSAEKPRAWNNSCNAVCQTYVHSFSPK